MTRLCSLPVNEWYSLSLSLHSDPLSSSLQPPIHPRMVPRKPHCLTRKNTHTSHPSPPTVLSNTLCGWLQGAPSKKKKNLQSKSRNVNWWMLPVNELQQKNRDGFCSAADADAGVTFHTNAAFSICFVSRCKSCAENRGVLFVFGHDLAHRLIHSWNWQTLWRHCRCDNSWVTLISIMRTGSLFCPPTCLSDRECLPAVTSYHHGCGSRVCVCMSELGEAEYT